MAFSVLVTGATGLQGGAVARRLLEDGHTVTVLTRKPDSAPARELAGRGARLVTGDFTEPASLPGAFAGVDVAFAMGTPLEAGPDGETRQAITLLDAAAAAGVRHVVYSSAANADKGTGISWFDSKLEVEKHLSGLGVPWTIVAPAVFMEVVSSAQTVAGLREGKLIMPLSPDRTLQYVDPEDIAGFVSLVLADPGRFAGRRVDLVSDVTTGPALADLLTRHTGRPITYTRNTVEELRRYGGDDVAKMFIWFEDGGFDMDAAALHTEFPEVGWHTFEQWAARQDWAEVMNRQPAW
ncbi:uncharacterized protein YbjT (DUF2867 family) [Actinoplanes tereljensis]|uniref:NmrA-like domain-containing protein n=1 Tax=Paractinoplanes tereljensis TaxID=571912 RepID=A0A919NFR4_9ACTN|nr:NmrA/HSCARG family protein [Actinoplanes tereljensis]GIF17784.1 hypothetical protein Ate02nite_05140 [Actinoplanes tereljensis]